MSQYTLPQLLLIGALSLGQTALLSSCAHEGDRKGAGSETKTDLGPTGNTQVAARFNAYKAKRASEATGCRGLTSATRVMVTGFGLFTGVDFNISGLVVQSFADTAFTPEDLALNGTDAIGTAGVVAAGLIPESAKGGVTSVRQMTIRGKEYEICFVTLDVLWDLAAAIIVQEAEAFQPAMIIMSGRGADQAIFEAGALNDAAVGLPGFSSSGSTQQANAPVGPPILPGRPYKSLMTWNKIALHAAAKPLVHSIGHTVTYAAGPRTTNNYICNNVSYVVLEAVNGAKMELAGGQIKWQPAINSQPKVGFFHYPPSATNERTKVATWVRLLATDIDTELNPPPTVSP